MSDDEYSGMWDSAVDLLKRCTVCNTCGRQGAVTWECSRCEEDKVDNQD